MNNRAVFICNLFLVCLWLYFWHWNLPMFLIQVQYRFDRIDVYLDRNKLFCTVQRICGYLDQKWTEFIFSSKYEILLLNLSDLSELKLDLFYLRSRWWFSINLKCNKIIGWCRGCFVVNCDACSDFISIATQFIIGV